MHSTLQHDLEVFRNPVPFLGLFIGFLFFFVAFLLDRFAVIKIGWFLRAPTFSYVFLFALGVGCLWTLTLVMSLMRPVIIIDKQSITLCQITVPSQCIEIDLNQIRGASVWSYPDTVPSYLILDIDQIPQAKRDSVVWAKVENTRFYYECSNLTVVPSEIASAISERLAEDGATN